MGAKTVLYALVSVTSVAYTFKTMFTLILFLSSEVSGLLNYKKVYKDISLWNGIVCNALLVVLFVSNHAICASKHLKLKMSSMGLSPIHRSLFNFTTCLTLNILMNQWVTLLPTLPLLWNLMSFQYISTICQTVHAISWFFILSIMYVLDISEFFGLKQIQYFHHEFGCPMTSKTVYAQNFYHNMRHPCFIGWTCVLWLVPCLSIDRFILASGFTLYFLYGSRLEVKDFYYVRKMYYKKVTSIVRVSQSP
uniref:Nurim n=1 Tax=Ciona intestinalis TaxID=7719 RepID=F6UP59_CIOIN|nr:nurim-like [Ciona intestinalis]|eukprot:XP_002122792.1 nurim-like [Ciona intestinalis]